MSCYRPETPATSPAVANPHDHNPFALMQPRLPTVTPKEARNGARVIANDVAPLGVYLPEYYVLTPYMRSHTCGKPAAYSSRSTSACSRLLAAISMTTASIRCSMPSAGPLEPEGPSKKISPFFSISWASMLLPDPSPPKPP